jgi:hypothetical protein
MVVTDSLYIFTMGRTDVLTPFSNICRPLVYF